MKQRFITLTLLLFTTVLFTNITQAKIWRVNNTPGVQADFSTANAAVAAAAEGDTLYLEGSATQYNFTINKRLVVIGAGYFLSGNDSNPGLQANPYPATVSVTIDSAASGSRFIGLSGGYSGLKGPDDISIIRCQVTFLNASNAGVFTNWKIKQCYFSNLGISYPLVNWEFTNNIVYGAITFNGQNCLIRNNTFRHSPNVTGAYFTNNIILANTATFVNSTVKYNIAVGNNVLPAGNNNQNGISQGTLIVGVGSTDGYYQLAANSPAIGAGEPINGETPDAGAFGTATPYRLSGIPPIPTIYALSAPTSVPANATSIEVTFSTRSNN